MPAACPAGYVAGMAQTLLYKDWTTLEILHCHNSQRFYLGLQYFFKGCPLLG
jgi:hypothetical protein